MRAYIDSDILIWHLRGERRAAGFLRALAADSSVELWMGALQRAELVFFMRPAEEAGTLLLLSRFRTAPVTEEIVDNAGQLYRRWHRSHGTDINDAILAATVISTGGRIYSQNLKHYPMPEVLASRAW